MHRVLIFGFVLFIFISDAKAQFLQHYGFRIGGNASTVAGNIYETAHRTGFQAAVFAEIIDHSSFSIVGEIEYSRRGFISESKQSYPTPQSTQATTTLDYVSMPLIARLRYPGEASVVPYVVGGPRLDVLIGRNPGRFEFSTISLFGDGLSQHFSDVSLAGTVGIGAAVDQLIGREVRVEARYNLGWTDLLQHELSRFDVRSRWIDVSVALCY